MRRWMWMLSLTMAVLVVLTLTIGFVFFEPQAPATDTSPASEETGTAVPLVDKAPAAGNLSVRGPIRVPVITYHHVAPGLKDPYNVEPKHFDAQMALLKAKGYHAISIFELVNALYKGGQLPEKPVLITFDDGYKDNYEHAFPILRKHGMKASIYLIGARIGVRPEFMTWEMVREMTLSGLVNFQNHSWDLHDMIPDESGVVRAPLTIRHRKESQEAYLRRISEDLIKNSRVISAVTEQPVVSITYPNGIDTPDVVQACRNAGLLVGFNGYNFHANQLSNQLDVFHMTRYNVGPQDSAQEVLQRMERDVLKK